MSKTQQPELQDEDDEIRITQRTDTLQYTGDQRKKWHRDADDMRRYFDEQYEDDPDVHIPPYERDNIPAYKRHVWPNLIEHNQDGPPEGATRDKGGTDVLATGRPGSGKSTLALYIAQRLMSANDEKVVWRGSTARSEWLPFAPWTTLCLPSGVDIDVTLEPLYYQDDTVHNVPLENLVRDVVYYDDTRELNEDILSPGQFHVVYPDPLMRGCQSAYEEADEKGYDDLEFTREDPTKHWWFGWILDRVQNGPHHWTSLILDEIGDIAPQSAQKDEFATYQKVELLKDTWVDARKKNLSLFLFGHSEVDIHQLIRHKIRWRITMNGESNPTSKSEVVGFNSIPMDSPKTASRLDPGRFLVYNERNFDRLRYSKLPSELDYKLSISMEVS